MSVIYQFGSTPTSTYRATNTPSVVGASYTPQPYLVDIVLVGGGGGGGYYYGGGGGGGQVLQMSSILVNYGGTYLVTIGSGGIGSQGADGGGNIFNGGNGGTTTFLGYSAIGGGGGASRGRNDVNPIGSYALSQSYTSGTQTMYLNSVNGLSSGCVVWAYSSGSFNYFAEIISVNSVAKTIQTTGMPHSLSSGFILTIYDNISGGSSGASGGGGCGTDSVIFTSSSGLASAGNSGGYGTGNYFNGNDNIVGDRGAVFSCGGGGGGAGLAGNDGSADFNENEGVGGDGLTFTFAGSSYTFGAGGGGGVDVLSVYGEGGGPQGGSNTLGGYGGSGGDTGAATSAGNNTGSGGGGGGGIVDANQGLPYPQGANGGSGIALIYSHYLGQVIQINSSGVFNS